MKNLSHLISLLIAAFFFGCNSNQSTGPTGGPPGSSNSYFPLTIGSTWTYQRGSSSTTIRTVAGDTTINSKKYMAIRTSNGGLYSGLYGYFRQEGKILYGLVKTDVPNTFVEIIFLKESGATTWNFSLTFDNTTADYHCTVKENPFMRVVLGKTYTNILHVVFEVSSKGAPVGSNEFFFAKGIGVIEEVRSFEGDSDTTKLVSHSIQ